MNFRTLVYYWREAMQSIARNSWISLASIGTVSVSLIIVGVFTLVFLNANQFTQGLESGLEIRAILKNEQSRTDLNRINYSIESISGVSFVEFISKNQALEEMKESLENRKEILEGLQSENPLPDAFKVKAETPEQIVPIAKEIEAIEGVEQVIYGQSFVEKLVAATRWIRYAGAGLLGILCLAAVFLISTTIKMSVFARRKEIEIMVLLGATKWFVRFPYLLEGMILGFLGSLLSGLVVGAGYLSLVNHLDQALPFVSLITDKLVVLKVLGGIVGVGLLIGAIGSTMSIRKFLKT
ncbi:MAG: ABC transporter permease [Peptococcaceae bacterium]|nr:ABC transporter permease [Peptococcaceae bacterium]